MSVDRHAIGNADRSNLSRYQHESSEGSVPRPSPSPAKQTQQTHRYKQRVLTEGSAEPESVVGTKLDASMSTEAEAVLAPNDLCEVRMDEKADDVWTPAVVINLQETDPGATSRTRRWFRSTGRAAGKRALGQTSYRVSLLDDTDEQYLFEEARVRRIPAEVADPNVPVMARDVKFGMKIKARYPGRDSGR